MKAIPRIQLNPLGKRLRRWQKQPAPPARDLLPAKIHPIIVVPGLLGTWPPAPAPQGRLDPVTSTYTNLLDGLESLGYRAGVSLFAFAYDWRRNITELVTLLGEEIGRIRRLANQPQPPDGPQVDYSRVDLLCHSMGGLIGRAYIQSDAYGDDVARLFLVAVPQTGALAAYYGYEGGDSTWIGIPVEGAQTMAVLAQAFEMRLHRRAYHVYRALRKRNLPDLFAYMQSELRSIRDFLPLARQNYLYRRDEAGNEVIYPYGDPPGHPENPFLEKLNHPDYLDRLDRIKEIVCIYSSSVPTLARVLVEEPGPHPLYPHGRPVTEQPAENRLPGDSIVGVFSARLQLPDTRSDGQSWQVQVRNEEVSGLLNQRIDHVQIVADPAPVRYILGHFTRAEAASLTAEVWDGPALNARRPNLVALFI